jgi:hypothetical protein
MRLRFCDEFGAGYGWIADEFLERCSHALVVAGRVWLIDPLDTDDLDERIAAAGEPAGVLQLVDRHNRDCAALAARLRVPHHVVPRTPMPPFEFISIRRGRLWKEVALWWPEERVLACGDAFGTAAYFLAGSDRVALHPLLRARPPRRQLEGLDPEVILCGHGQGVFADAAVALREALSTSRRRMPAQAASAVRAWRSSRS